MAELTDAALEIAAAAAMGGVRKSDFPNAQEELRELRLPDIFSWHWPDGTTTAASRWHPLEEDEDGNPTKEAAAQLWGVLAWLVRRKKWSLNYLQLEGDNSPVYIAESGGGGRPVTFEMGGTLPRALLLAVVAAVGENSERS